MADDIVVNIAFKGNANEFLAELSRSVGRAKTQLQEMGQSTAALSRLETQLAKMAGTANQAAAATGRAAQATQGWAQKWTPFKGQFQQAEATSKALWGSIDTGIRASEASLARASKAVAQFDQSQRNAAQNRATGNPMADWDKQFAAATKAADANAAAMKRAQAAVEQYQNSLSNTRYVLYDVAGTLSILGIGLVAPLAAATGVAIKFEAAFAQVQRTSGLVGDELADLKDEFDNLYASLPVTYEALAQIATLAGQLGVPAKDVANFTETVAKTATVTNLSVDQAATAFGRLNALIPNVQGQYDRLGSSIAKVGVNSVATESEIVNIATQISAMGSFAGFTAQDIIGLSGALASIGAQPELSRGTVTRVFTLMSRAVAAGGDSLEKFAQVSGVSSADFKKTWGTPAFTQTFLGFMQGIRKSGGDAVGTLNELGITSVRDVPLLLRLANAADTTGKAGALLAQTIGDSNSGWSENIELQRQYAIISATVASKFQILTNNFNLFLQAVGGPMLGPLGDFLDWLTGVVGWATDLAKTDLGGSFFAVLAAVTALTGVLAVSAGAMALMGASSIGVYQALLFLSKQSPITATALLGVSGAASLANGTLKASATSALLFSRALKTISVIGAILILPSLFEEISNAMDDLQGIVRGSKNAIPNFITAMEGVAGPTDKALTAVDRLRAGMLRLSSTEGGRRAIEDIKNQFKDLATAGDTAGLRNLIDQLSKGLGATGQDIVNTMPGAKAALDSLKTSYVALKSANTGTTGSVDQLGGSLDGMAQEAQAAADALQQYKDELDQVNGKQITAAEAVDRMHSAINRATEAMKAGDVTLDGFNDSSIAFRDSMREIEGTARDAGEAILENGGTVEDATAQWDAGRQAIVDMLIQMGYAPADAQAWADAQYGSAKQISDAFAMIKAALDRVPTTKSIYVSANTSQAQGEIDQFIRYNNGKVIRITVAANGMTGGSYSVYGGIPRAFAGGGKISGPGTGTSDSILARVSNREYIVRERAAQAIGYGRLDYMNRTGKIPSFASGGRVGGGSPSWSSSDRTLTVMLSAVDRQLLAEAGNVQLILDGKDIAKATSSANFVSAQRGSS